MITIRMIKSIIRYIGGVHMETLEVRNIELSGTNYEIGYRLGELVANMPEIIEGQINKSNLVSKKRRKRDDRVV